MEVAKPDVSPRRSASEIWELCLRTITILFWAALLVRFFLSLANPFWLLALAMVISPVVLALIVAHICLSMFYGKKRVVLVLRKFRRKETSTAITAAYVRRLKRRYRLLTFYDATFPRAGLPAAVQYVIYASTPFAVVLVAIIPLIGMMIYPPVPLIGIQPLLGILTLVAGPMLMPVFIFNFALLLTLTICLFVHRSRIYWRASKCISRGDEVESITEVIWDLSSWFRAASFMGARSTVVELDSAIWQEAVRSSAAAAHAIIIDASHHSPSLAWEIEYCVGNHRKKTLFIGDMNALRLAPQAFPPHPGIDRIFGYDLSARRFGRAFARNLRVALDGIAATRPLRSAHRAWHILRCAFAAFAIYATASFLALTVTVAILESAIFRERFADSIMTVPELAWAAVNNIPGLLKIPRLLSMSPHELRLYIEEQRRKDGIELPPDDD